MSNIEKGKEIISFGVKALKNIKDTLKFFGPDYIKRVPEDKQQFFIFSDNMESKDVDRIMVFTNRIGEYTKTFIKQAKCSKKESPYSNIDEVVHLYTNLHSEVEDGIEGVTYNAIEITKDYYAKLMHAIMDDIKRIQQEYDLDIDIVSEIAKEIKQINPDDLDEKDENLEELGVSIEWTTEVH